MKNFTKGSKMSVILMLTLISLTVSGIAQDSSGTAGTLLDTGQTVIRKGDTFRIIPETRYLKAGDTLTAFSIKDERKLVYLLSDYKLILRLNKNLRNQLRLNRLSKGFLRKRIYAQDTLLMNKDTIISRKTQQLSNFRKKENLYQERIKQKNRTIFLSGGAGLLIGALVGMLAAN